MEKLELALFDYAQATKPTKIGLEFLNQTGLSRNKSIAKKYLDVQLYMW